MVGGTSAQMKTSEKLDLGFKMPTSYPENSRVLQEPVRKGLIDGFTA